jgi:nucleoside-diphosphate-sugar epimerase
MNGQTVAVGDGLANLVYVDDVADAIILAISRAEAIGGTFIVNNDLERVRWKQYVQKYADAIGVPAKTSGEFGFTLQKLRNLVSIIADSVVPARKLMTAPETLALVARIPIAIKFGNMIFRGNKREEMARKVAVATGLDARAELRAIRSNYMQKYEMMDKQFYGVLTNRAIFSSAKARSALGFELTSFDDGIAKTLEWVKWARYDQPQS